MAITCALTWACTPASGPAAGTAAVPTASGSRTSEPADSPSVEQTAARAKSGCWVSKPYEVCFAAPWARKGDPTVLDRHSALFKSAGSGDTIYAAMFRWDMAAPTKALIAAQRRGATVYLVGDDDLRKNKYGRRLISTIESADPARKNVTICRGSCLPWRAPGPFPDSQNVMHLKLYVTEIGGVRSLITSSANLEGRQHSQGNSFLKVDDDGLFTFGVAYFDRLRAQSNTANGVTWGDAQKTYSAPRLTAQVYPRDTDLLVRTLRSISCRKGANQVAAHFAVIQRADVRQQYARLASSGCRVRLVTTRDTIENWLEAAVPLPGGGTGRVPSANVKTIHTHDKLLVVHALYQGKPTYLVVTGTSNTTCGGLSYNDELMLRIVGNRWLYGQYLAYFNDAFRHAYQGTSPIHPVMKPCR